MWITKDVNLPESLIKAQREGMLVVFAGAGVSKSPPANYPDFNQLADQVAQQAGGVLKRDRNEPIDHFLGKLKKQGPDVHTIVRQILSNPESRPTELHYDLLSLFRNPEDIRIVTTNFDMHFSRAAAELFGSSVKIYHAPALPLGRRFNGVVYLHGCVDQQPEDLIITDGDFGRAYLTDGWATRFLQAMFTNYVVLFVGYSHNDLIIQYLARGLPPDTPRYVLTSSGNDEHWKSLGISPIAYPLRDAENKHHALVEAVSTWAKQAKMGFLEHEQRIKRIVESPPPLEPEVADYMEGTLKELPTARFFARYARTSEWLHWAEQKGAFSTLFKPGEQIDEIAQTIAIWFAENYVCQHPGEALALVQRQGQVLNPILWRAIARHLVFCEPRPDAETLASWVTVLLRSAPEPERQSNFLDYLVDSCCHPEDDVPALLLFEHLTRPYLIMKPYFGFWGEEQKGDKKVDFEIALQGDEHWLRKTWEKLFRPNLEAFAHQLEPILTSYLQRAHYLLRATGRANGKWDPESFRRSAIEPHEQDLYPTRFDILVDAARDVIECLLTYDPGRGQAVIKAWVSSNVPLLKRLGIHGTTQNCGLTPDEKVDWLLERDWLYAPGLEHEVFRLLKDAYPNASETVRAYVLQQAERGSVGKEAESVDEQTHQYEIYNLLYWLQQVAPNCQLAAERFRVIQEAHSDFQPPGHPDLDAWSSDGWIGPRSPVTADELLAKSPQELFDWLLTYQGEKFRGPDREGLLSSVSEAVTKVFDWGWQLVEALKVRGEWTSDLWKSIIQGWKGAAMSEDHWRNVLDLLKGQPQLDAFTYVIADLLLEGVRKTEGGLPTLLLPQTESLAGQLWDRIDRLVKEAPENGNWLTKAINHPGGKIAEFWVHALSKRRTEAKEKWSALPDEYQGYFERVLSGKSYAAQMGRILLASQLHFLFALAPDWTRKNILPLLDWPTDRRRAQQAWHGYLVWGRWNEALLPDLLPLYEQAFPELPGDLSGMRDRFCEHLARIAVYSSIIPIRNGWLSRFLMKAEEKDRKSWASHVRHQLSSLPHDAARDVWENWMREYWSQRITGIPLPLSSDELEEMVAWALELKPVFSSVVDQVCASPAPTLKYTIVYHELVKRKFANRYPESVSKLLLHLLSSACEPFYHCDDIANLVRELIIANVSRDMLRPLCEHLARLGCPQVSQLRQLLGDE